MHDGERPAAGARFCTRCGRGLVDGRCPLHDAPAPAPTPRGRGWWLLAHALTLALLAALVWNQYGLVQSLQVQGREAERLDRRLARLEDVLERRGARMDRDEKALEQLTGRVGAVEDELEAEPAVIAVARRVRASVLTVEAGSRLGSGFVVRDRHGRLLVVTNHHVVAGVWSRGRRRVTLSREDASYDGTVVRVRTERDLAVIEADLSFRPLPLASAEPRVGDTVIAVGSPFGLEGTVSTGIVSALREEYIQFSAPVSPGSSGGPVVNTQGEVVGVTTAKVVSGGAEGLSFAIPVETVCRTVVSC